MYLSIDDQNSARYHRNNEGLNYITPIPYFIFPLYLEDENNIDYITT